ncbi:DNA/RNA polymerase [Armillaria gallica]|uniref:DNA/RNA polymerase n=1 Tax=Armillaria gallica TaxID=47427 RepID=A0A2H3DJS5_ARMGA|nr:DNA/RNA polymerase [Armillaria gallica]
MPQPPHNELNNHVALDTIKSHLTLFHIITPINITCFRELLDSHPNQELVSSVCVGLEAGFWPWADTNNPGYPTTNDNSFRPLRDHSHVDFIRSQRDTEIDLGRFSHSFGSDLLPGMHSFKPHSTKLRLIVNHSAGDFSPNSMIPKHEGHAHLDTLKHLGRALIHARRKHGRDVKLVLFKSDVSQAYRRLPMHVLWKIRQVVTIENQHHVDRCNNFGNRGAGRIWCTFFGLVLWIATFVKLLTDIFGYVNDSFSWEFADRETWYGPYQKYLPAKQTTLLTLFDELGVPHEEGKQLHGCILTIIGFDVDPNAMTITMPITSRLELISAIRNFAVVGSRRSLHDFESLGGWCNWSFNAYPLLRPGLSTLYAKKHGKTQPFQLIWISKALCRELLWMAEHLEHMPGILFLDSLEWGPHLADILVQTDASSKGLSIWIPQFAAGFYSHFTMPSEEGIFFSEALAVVSALLMTLLLSSKPRCILIYTNNTNTVDIFNSLHAKPFYNSLLITAVDALITYKAQLRVLHIPGSQNTIADALSHDNHDFVLSQHPQAKLLKFSPPQLTSGLDNIK